MSRSICISYLDEASGDETRIEVRPPYFLLGTQQSSMKFWSLVALRGVGISRLAELGVMDPVGFVGWDELALLDRELTLLRDNLPTIPFPAEVKAEWVSHLTYCYCLLVDTAPKGSTPRLDIG
jgi:hypothetical protein